MTNLQAFQEYMANADKGNLILPMYSIDPTLSDKNAVSMALGMLERADDVDYSQLSTSEKLSENSRKSLRKRALGILSDNGIVINTIQDKVIYGSGF